MLEEDAVEGIRDFILSISPQKELRDIWFLMEAAYTSEYREFVREVFEEYIADITDPDIIQKILDHIRGPPRSQPPPLKPATAIQS